MKANTGVQFDIVSDFLENRLFSAMPLNQN